MYKGGDLLTEAGTYEIACALRGRSVHGTRKEAANPASECLSVRDRTRLMGECDFYRWALTRPRYTLSPTLNLKVAMLPVVMVGESAGIASTVCGGNDDMLRPRRGAPARAGSTLDRPAFFFCHPLPGADTLPTRAHAAGKQAQGSSAGQGGRGAAIASGGPRPRMRQPAKGTLHAAAPSTPAAASPAGLTSAGRRGARSRTRVSGRWQPGRHPPPTRGGRPGRGPWRPAARSMTLRPPNPSGA